MVYILGLQMTDVELDARITELEENGGAGTINSKFNSYFSYTAKKYQYILE